jgi:hypothetical protein
VKNHFPPLFFVLILLVTVRILPIQANPGLDITVKTSKQQYYNRDIVQVYGNLTLDGVPVTDGLVGLQIQTPNDKLLTIRTLSTGNPPPQTPYIFIEYIVPCDQSGNPKFSFNRKAHENAYFKISIVNQDIEPHNVTMPMVTYYNDNTPFGSAEAYANPLSPGSPATFLASIPIPADAVLGTATVYGNAYTKAPKLGGTPYCSEVNATFQIIDGAFGTGGQAIQNQFTILQETGNFNTTFRLAKNAQAGNYTIYVSSRYFGYETFGNATFRVLILGDINLDGVVNYKDASLFRQAYLDGYNPLADLDFNGIIDYKDANIFRQNYLAYG